MIKSQTVTFTNNQPKILNVENSMTSETSSLTQS
jgi:hypothetical protein